MAGSKQINLLCLLLSRLEHLSVDSRWARRSSGLRGNIVKVLEEAESSRVTPERLDLLINHSFEILQQAAQEIPDIENLINDSKNKE